MGLPPWETSDSQQFVLITGANSGLGFAIASRLVEEFITTPSTPATKHLIIILCTRTPLKTRYTISRLRAHLRTVVEYSQWAKKQRQDAAAQGLEYKWETLVQRVHFLGVEVDLCDLKSIYALADQLINGTVGSPDATTAEGRKLPHGSPGTSSYKEGIVQDTWALSQEPGSHGANRAWGWGLNGIRIPRLDLIILTAGMGGWLGVDWLRAIPEVLFNMREAVTWPIYKLADVGKTVKSQSSYKSTKSADEATQPLLSYQEKPEEPPLGEVFCSNLFGHYVLSHELMPLLSIPATSSSRSGGRIIWTSTIEALGTSFKLDDFQGLTSLVPYESSKRLIDLLALTSELPSVKRVAAPFFDSSKTVTASSGAESNNDPTVKRVKPTIHLTHPGIFVSEIFPLNFILVAFYRALFYLVRWFGSPWHTITAEAGAVSAVWLSLLDQDELDRLEGNGLAKHKWGSAASPGGEERVKKTEVPGWGWNGQVKDSSDAGERLKGRKRDAVDLTVEAKEEFEILGSKCWAEIENLRREWEGVLGVREGKGKQ